jgi:hypothetical protein
MASMRRSAAILLTLPLAACGRHSAPPPPVAPGRRAEAVQDADRLYRDDRTALDSVRVVISDPESLKLWWGRATADTPEPRPTVPTVDFTKNNVLLVAAGRRNAGDRIRVDSVGFEIRPEPGGGRSEVWFAIVRTIPDCNPFPGTAYPVEVVRIPKVSSQLEFVDRVVACPGAPDARATAGETSGPS